MKPIFLRRNMVRLRSLMERYRYRKSFTLPDVRCIKAPIILEACFCRIGFTDDSHMLAFGNGKTGIPGCMHSGVTVSVGFADMVDF